MKFERRFPNIEAFQIGVDIIPDWFKKEINLNRATTCENIEGTVSAKINVEGYGLMHANHGDWVINDGNLIYVCKLWLFDRIYKSVGE